MRSGIVSLLFVLFSIAPSFLHAQTAGSPGSLLMYALIAIIAIVLLFFLLQISDNLLSIEAKNSGIDEKGANLSLFPNLSEIFRPKLPSYAANQKVNVLRKGHDILLEGAAKPAINESVSVNTYAVQPPNFLGISPIPKLEVQVGDTVKAGDILLYDKKEPLIKHVAPVSGEVIAINRGAKRSIAKVVILADKEQSYREMTPPDLATCERQELVDFLLDSGVWPLIRQRPYNIIAEDNVVPRDIFISTFDSAPLAPDLNFVVEGQGAAFQKGLDVLAQLTEGSVHLGLNVDANHPPSSVFLEATGVEKHWFAGKHPAGNVGVQIHNVAPMAAQERVWTLDVQDVITIGRLYTENRFNSERLVVLAGAELEEPSYVKTYLGASIDDLLRDNVTSENVRIISGDILSGTKKGKEAYLDTFDNQVTVIEEGNFFEMFGWLVPQGVRPTISKTFPLSQIPGTKFKANTNTHGERRAFVVTGQYEKMLPMDIYPQHLMKAILVNDYEGMEGLGLHELVEEDIALCEFACTSKQPLQKILREGLEMMRAQG